MQSVSNLNSINQFLILFLGIAVVAFGIRLLNKFANQQKEKVLANIVYFLSSQAIIAGLLILANCFKNWNTIIEHTTAQGIMFTNGVLLFGAGLLGFVLQNMANKK